MSTKKSARAPNPTLAVAGGAIGARPWPVILPRPVECQLTGGEFRAGRRIIVAAASGLEPITRLAAQWLGLSATDAAVGGSRAAIQLSLDATLAAEGYVLTLTPVRITIAGGSPSGVLYGVQTLRQVIGLGPLTEGTALPCLSIRDQPRFAWRGLMLDCSRTFQSLDYLRRTVDRLSYYKLNVLHLHLTDDQGWRMEIRRHPELTGHGARFSARYHEPESHQGCYTQDQLRELVAYAQSRGVTIVPEIEMPGHALAALVCHPELSCTGHIPDDIYPFGQGAAITEDIFCAGNDATFAFLEGVLTEVLDVFPSRFIHLGGDEAPKARWHACPKCQARLRAAGLKDASELQGYFMQRMGRFLASRGRRLIGWEEILEGGLAPDAAVMSWRGVAGGIAAAQAGHDVVMSPATHCYFDYAYEAIDSRRAYEFDPVAGLGADQATRVQGLQANFWSHLDRSAAAVDRQLFPRLLALAERAWSPKEANRWDEFAPRLTAQQPRLAAMGATGRAGPLEGAAPHHR